MQLALRGTAHPRQGLPLEILAGVVTIGCLRSAIEQIKATRITTQVAVLVLALAALILATSASPMTPLVETAVGIKSFSPTRGAAGTVVVIKGSGFLGATAVRFNGVDASSFTVNNAKQITATVADGTTSGPVSVLNPSGDGTSTTNFVVQSSGGLYSSAGCLDDGNSDVPAGNEVYLSLGWLVVNATYLKQFFKNIVATLTVNGKAVKSPDKYWDKKGFQDLSTPPFTWKTVWRYNTGIVLANKGDTMTFSYLSTLTNPITDGAGNYPAGVFVSVNCTVHAV